MRSKRFNLSMLILILCAVFLPYCIQSCAKGCVRCGSDSKCSACDTNEQYFRKDDGTCEQAQIENCLVSGFEKKECLQCDASMVFDSATSKCVKISSSQKESHCQMYNPSAECVACEKEYYLSGGECFPATVEVEHCLVFSKANYCLICLGNRRFDEETGKCLDFTPVVNCGIHTTAVCDKCLHDYAKIPGSLSLIAGGDLFTEALLSKISFYTNDVSFKSSFRQTTPTQCTQMTAKCSKFAFDATTRYPTGCEVCMPNYLLNPDTKECDEMPTPIIPNCRFYENATTCKTCFEQYYLELNECKAHTEVSECMTYNPIVNECQACNLSHTRTSGSVCTKRTLESIDNCDILNVTLDECQKCFDAYRFTDDKKACLSSIVNCAASGYAASTISTTEYLCDTCISNYYPATNKKTCVQQSSPHCDAYEVGNNSCTSCVNFDFYLDGTTPGVLCKAKTVPNCAKFTQDHDNKCLECNMLFSLESVNKTCVAHTDVNCARNTLNQTDCLACKPGFILDGANPCKESKRGYDPLCKETGSTDGKCEKCASGYSPYKRELFWAKNHANCDAMNIANGYCIQCSENMDGTPLDAGPPEVGPSCTPRAGAEGKCLQLSSNVFEALLDNDGNCKKCRNPETHYLQSGICKPRTDYLVRNCSENSKNNDTCEICTEGFAFDSLGESTPTCMPKPSEFSEIQNCDIYDYYVDGKCLQCQAGFTKTDGTPDTCDSSGGTELPDFNKYHLLVDSQLKIGAGQREDPSVPNCAESIYVFEGGAAKELCVKCKDGFMQKVESSFTPYLYDDYDQTTNLWSMSSKYQIIECVSITKDDFVKYAADSDNTELANNCLAANLISTTDGYKCLKCKDNFVGVVKGMAFNKSGSAIPSPRSFAECNLASQYGLKSTNTNQGFRFMDSTNQIFVKQPGIIYDTCTDATKNAVLFAKITADSFTLEQEGVDGAEKPQWDCMVIPELKKQGACVSYFLENDIVDASRDYSTADFKCFKCEPGYRLRFATKDGFFGQCEPIQNCDLSPTSAVQNSWLDSCSKCRDGYSWDYLDHADYKIPNIQKCVDSRRFPGCLVMNSTTKKCLICKPGLTMNISTNKCEQYPPSCATPGFPKLERLQFSGHQKSYKFNQAFFRHFFADYLKTGKNICGSCRTGNHWYMGSDATFGNRKICRNIDFIGLIVNGCKSYHGYLINACKHCKESYAYNLISRTCLRKSLHSNLRRCQIMNSIISPSYCVSCMDGMLPDASGQCVSSTFCEKIDHNNYPNTCAFCESGYKIHPTEKWHCEKIGTEKECVKFKNDGRCLECKDPEKTVIYWGNTSEAVRCVKNPSNRKALVNGYTYEYTNVAGTETYVAFLKIDSDFAVIGRSNLNAWDKYPAEFEYMCVRDYEDCGCKEMDNAVNCKTCHDTHYLDSSTKKCILGVMKGCLKFTGNDQCGLCDVSKSEKTGGQTFYKSGNKCLPHTLVNCFKVYPTTDTCETCQKGYFENSGKCYPNKVAKCLEFVSNKDECTKCEKSYYLDNKKCLKHTVGNCKNYNPASNSCDECADNFYRFTDGVSPNFKCAEHTAKNCKTKSKTSNTCTDCEEGEFYPSGSDGCIAILPIPNCKETDKISGKCKVCEEGFWLGSTDFKCNANPSGVKNCDVYSDKTTCTKCLSTHFLADNACVLLTDVIGNCEIQSGQGVCEKCNVKHIKSGDGKTCTAVTEQTCATWVDLANCESCLGNNVLKTNQGGQVICIASGLAHCKTAQLESEVISCLACNSGFILREGKCHAPKISILNCQMYDPETEKCSECFSGFLLSVLKDKCENRIGEAGAYCATGHLVNLQEPVCSMCDFGHYENAEGKCVSCGGDGCMICDLTSNAKCNLCMSSWYMKADKTCAENNPKAPTSVRIVGVLSVLGLMFLLFRE